MDCLRISIFCNCTFVIDVCVLLDCLFVKSNLHCYNLVYLRSQYIAKYEQEGTPKTGGYSQIPHSNIKRIFFFMSSLVNSLFFFSFILNKAVTL